MKSSSYGYFTRAIRATLLTYMTGYLQAISVACARAGLLFRSAEAPIFVASPKDLTKVAVGHTAVLTCQVAGAPKPSLVWQKSADLIDIRDLHDPRVTVLPSGDLQIEVNNRFIRYLTMFI